MNADAENVVADHTPSLKSLIHHEIEHGCYRQVNKRLSLEVGLYHLYGSRADGFWRANCQLGELKQRHDHARVGG